MLIIIIVISHSIMSMWQAHRRRHHNHHQHHHYHNHHHHLHHRRRHQHHHHYYIIVVVIITRVLWISCGHFLQKEDHSSPMRARHGLSFVTGSSMSYEQLRPSLWYCLQCHTTVCYTAVSLQWHHNERNGGSNHQPHDCLLNRLFGHRSKKTSKLRVTGLCAGNSPVTGEFPAQRASNAENVSIWWRHHDQE